MRRSYRVIGYIGSTFQKVEITGSVYSDRIIYEGYQYLRDQSHDCISSNNLAIMTVKQPQVQRIDRANVADIIQAIVDDGCCVIKNFTSVETINNVNSEAQPYLDADKPWKVSHIQTSMETVMYPY